MFFLHVSFIKQKIFLSIYLAFHSPSIHNVIYFRCDASSFLLILFHHFRRSFVSQFYSAFSKQPEIFVASMENGRKPSAATHTRSTSRFPSPSWTFEGSSCSAYVHATPSATPFFNRGARTLFRASFSSLSPVVFFLSFFFFFLFLRFSESSGLTPCFVERFSTRACTQI